MKHMESDIFSSENIFTEKNLEIEELGKKISN